MTNLSWLPALAEVAALLVAARTLVVDPRRRRDLLTLVLAAGALAAPMLVLSPFGPRNFLPGYLLLSAAALVLFRELQERRVETAGEPADPTVRSRLLTQVVAVGAAVVVVAILCQYLVVYRVIHKEVDRRVSYFTASANNGVPRVYNYTLPFQNYVHQPDPTPGLWARRFKAYYHLPAGLRIILMDRYANTGITSHTSKSGDDK